MQEGMWRAYWASRKYFLGEACAFTGHGRISKEIRLMSINHACPLYPTDILAAPLFSASDEANQALSAD